MLQNMQPVVTIWALLCNDSYKFGMK